MRQKIVGTYEMGWECVELVLREGTGGEFYFIPEKGHVARIKIGADQPAWRDLVGVLLHECIEFSFDRAGTRFAPACEMARDHASYLFSMNHTQFTEACARAGEFIAAALPDLAAAWKQWRKSKLIGAK